jgi:tetratricopeptide (TPR) repeat protein
VAEALDLFVRVLRAERYYEEAETPLREALDLRRQALGNEHSDVARTIVDLASLLDTLGNRTEAEALFREALAIWRKLPGDHSAQMVYCLRSFGRMLQLRGDRIGASDLLLEAWSIATNPGFTEPQRRTAIATSLASLFAEWTKTDPSKAAQAAVWKGRISELNEATKTSGPSPAEDVK